MGRAIISTVLGVFLSATSAWPCQVAGNLVTNCGFPTNTSSWTVDSGTCAHNTADGSSAAGNIECDAIDSDGRFVFLISQCITPASGDTYGYGADAQRVSGGTGNLSCQIALADHADLTCSSNINSGNTSWPPGTGIYTQSSSASFGADLTFTQSIRVSISCIVISIYSPDFADFVVRIDDVFVGIGLVPVELQEFSVE